MSAVKDITGFTSGLLTVLSREGSDENGSAAWRCSCECGNEIVVPGKLIRNNKVKSCGCVKNIIGRKFGKLTVVEKEVSLGKKKYQYSCLCDCGNVISVARSNLVTGNTKSCGCIIQEIAKERIIDMTGKRFGRLEVIEMVPRIGKEIIKWKCLCSCGNIHIVSRLDLTSGDVKSCGCLKRERDQTFSKTHGLSREGIYGVWCNMKSRCYNKSSQDYPYYGGRGIFIVNEWHDFKKFYDDMHPRPEGATIERIDNNGPYCKTNCRWATRVDQANNKRNNLLITFDGKTKTLAQWSKDTGIKSHTLRSRIYEYGWSVEEALTTPLRSKGQTR